MGLYKQKGSKRYWYEFQYNGIVFRESTGTTKKVLAQKIYDARRREVEEHGGGVRKRALLKTFIVAADDHVEAKEGRLSPKAMEILEREVAHLKPAFAKMLLVDITPAHIKKFMNNRLVQGASPRSVNMDLEALRAILRRNGLWEQIRPDFSMLRIPRNKGKALSQDDEKLLLEACAASISRVLFPAVTLALCTGMRFGEIINLQWKQLDFSDRSLTVGLTKTEAGTSRHIPLNDRAMAALLNWSALFPERRPEHFVFPTEKYSLQPNGRPTSIYRHDPSRRMGSWRKAWEAVRRRTSISVRFHDLRHTAVTRMLEAGVPLTTVAAIVGWSPSTMYLMSRFYAHIGNHAMRKAVDALDGVVTKATSRKEMKSPGEENNGPTAEPKAPPNDGKDE